MKLEIHFQLGNKQNSYLGLRNKWAKTGLTMTHGLQIKSLVPRKGEKKVL